MTDFNAFVVGEGIFISCSVVRDAAFFIEGDKEGGDLMLFLLRFFRIVVGSGPIIDPSFFHFMRVRKQE
jgi:hypothetical protein